MNSKGQTLIEVIIASFVGILVVTALTFATIFSLRNASLSKNSAQATKLAQEGIEKVRIIRDRDSLISTSIIYPGTPPSRNIEKFSEFFSVNLSHNTCNTVAGDSPCYFRFNSGVLSQGTNTNFESIDHFQRQILIGDQSSPDTTGSQKIVTVVVSWNDFAGSHESRLTTILRKL